MAVLHITKDAFQPRTYCGRPTDTVEDTYKWVTDAKAKRDWHLDYMYCKRCKRKAGP